MYDTTKLNTKYYKSANYQNLTDFLEIFLWIEKTNNGVKRCLKSFLANKVLM